MLFFKKKKSQNTAPVVPVQISEPSPEGYVIELRDKYVDITKNNKEFFDGDVIAVSSSGEYMLATGFRNNTETIVLFTKSDLISTRKFEDGIAAVLVTDTGDAYVCDDNEHLLILSRDSSASKPIGFSPDDSAIVLSPDVCAFAYNDGENVFVKCFNLVEGKTWSKSVEFENNGNSGVVLYRDSSVLVLTVEGKEVARYDLFGKVIV